jgi:methyltransferase (TIGR00027 family)
MVSANPVSKTAFYCCGVRMKDAQTTHPVVGDQYAVRFMNDDGLKTFEEFSHFKAPNASNLARHRIIDDFLRDFILRSEDPYIVIIGAGFDSRAYRLPGGSWVELDEPDLIQYKNERLPITECKNLLNRIPIRFAKESLLEKLTSLPKHKTVVVVVEGVLMYLEGTTIENLLVTLNTVWPRHQLLCDLMSGQFFRKYSYKIHEKIKALGAQFSYTSDDPTMLFLKAGYIQKDRISTVLQAIKLRLLNIPVFLLKWFLPTLLEGYAVYRFEKK